MGPKAQGGLLQRLTGNSVKLFRDFVVLAGGQIVSKLLGFAAFAWLARSLDPVRYGAVEYVVGLSVFFALLVDGGLGVVGTRRSAGNPAILPLLAFQIPLARLMIAIVGIPVMVILAISTMRGAAPTALVWLFAGSLLTAPWRQQWLFQTTGHMAIIAKSEIIRMAIFAGTVWMMVRAPEDILIVGWAEFAAVAAMTAYCVLVQQRQITPVRLIGKLSGFVGLLKEGAAVGSTNMVWALNQFVPLFLITAILGGVEIAWFAGAARIVGSLLQFSNIYHFNLYPAVSRAHTTADGALRQLLERSLRVTAWVGVFVALALTVFALPLVRLTLGNNLLDAAPLLQVMSWTIPVALWSGHSRWALSAAGAQKLVLLSQILGLAVTATACIVLGQLFGGIGYAAGALAGAIAVWIFSHRSARIKGCSPPSYRLTLLPLGLAGAIIYASQFLKPDAWQMVMAVGAFVVLAPLLDRALLRDLRLLGTATH
jgi:O-antigen/teichoic acid export membrane protein